jgi:hypothetical protein
MLYFTVTSYTRLPVQQDVVPGLNVISTAVSSDLLFEQTSIPGQRWFMSSGIRVKSDTSPVVFPHKKQTLY